MKKLDKILFVISNISFGGAQRVTWTLAKEMKREGIEPIVVAIGNSTNNYDLPDGIEVIQLGQRHNYEMFKTIKKMRKVIRDTTPSIVITMGVAPCIFSVPAMFATHIPHIISERNDPRNFLGKAWVKHLSRYMMKKGNGFVFQTQDARDFYCDEIKNKSCIIPNPIMATNLPNADRSNVQKNIVTMGRLTLQKNHRMLIDAFEIFAQTYPEYNLHIYGSGELRSQMEEYIAQKSINDKICLFDACNDVLERIKTAEIFVLSSDFEGMPNALMEAMSMGLPCISTDCPCGGPRFLIENMKNGVLVPVGDTISLAKAMMQIAGDKQFADYIGQNATALRGELSVNTICEKWIAFCEETING